MFETALATILWHRVAFASVAFWRSAEARHLAATSALLIYRKTAPKATGRQDARTFLAMARVQMIMAIVDA